MKNIKLFLILAILSTIAISCETYDDYETERQAVVGFVEPQVNKSSLNEGESDTAEIDVYISEVADVDRTFTIEVVTEFNSTTTGPENYSFDPTFVIPANSHEGIVIINIVDVSLDQEVPQYLTIGIKEDPNYISGGKSTIVLKNRF